MFKKLFRQSGKDDDLIARLNSPIDAVREQALSTVTHDKAVTLPDDLLENLLQSKSSHLRDLALEYCQWHEPSRHADYLVAALSDSDRTIRWKAVRHLSSFPSPKAAAPLRQLFEQENKNTAPCTDTDLPMWIIMALGKCEDGQSAPFLFDLLTRTPPYPCANTAGSSLGQLKPVAYLEPLIQLLSSPEIEQVKGAVAALGGTGDPRATDALVALFSAQINAPMFPLITTMALKNIHDTRMIDPLLVYLADTSDAHFGIKSLVMDVLAQFKEQRVIDAILPYLTDDQPDLRAPAANALTAIGGAAVADRILAAFERETHPRISVVFVRALGRLHDPRAIPLLEQRRAGGDQRLNTEIDTALTALKTR